MIYSISPVGIALIKQFEGLRLEAYRDVAGVWTIGYGSTIGVTEGMVITEAQADTRLQLDVQTAVACVNRKVGPALTQNQFDALCSFVFNLGCADFSGSTMLRLLNAGEYDAAAEQFPLWDKAEVDGELVVVPGLLARRQAEQKLFLS